VNGDHPSFGTQVDPLLLVVERQRLVAGPLDSNADLVVDCPYRQSHRTDHPHEIGNSGFDHARVDTPTLIPSVSMPMSVHCGDQRDGIIEVDAGGSRLPTGGVASHVVRRDPSTQPWRRAADRQREEHGVDALVPRLDFAALAQSVYLNQAALGLIPAQSLEVMLEHLTQTAQHGNVRLSDEEELRILDELRAAGAILLGTEPGAVAVLGGASEGLAAAAALVPAGDVVLVATDFPSVTHPWLAGSASGRSVTWVEDRASVSLTESVLDAIRPGVAAVCVSAVMYGTGSRVDCAVLADSAHEVGARLIVDVTQLAGAGEVAMADWGADFVVTSGYKWLCGHRGSRVVRGS
jgi:hypothetical protein